MERKRKLPARAARTEGSNKKRTSTPPEPRIQTPTPPIPTPPVEQPLPRSIVAGKPLPTLDEPQPANLSSTHFQSVSESGVLAESLKRSRHAWISEGIFERYWTKVTKKKGAPEVLNNPAKDTMVKLGTCSITCEPHVLEAVMYAIKEPNRSIPFAPPQQSMQRPILQYGPPNGVMPPPPPPPAPVQHKPPPQPTPQQSPRMQDGGTSNATGASGVNGPSTHPAPGSAPPTPQSNRGTDPVIQMLAERAATDPELKALMRIVANGEASPEELKKFQAHIDDLTRIQKARIAAQAQMHQTGHPASSAHSNSQMNGTVRASPSPAPSIRHAPTPTPPPQPQALRSKGPVATKSEFSGVVFEFAGGSGDRFLFPKFSILEYLPGGQVIASFLIVRKGSAGDSSTYDPKLDYYQPITIRLYAYQGRQLDALQKVVAPQEEVRRYMDDIMDNMTRAEYVLLAMRLPRDNKEIATPAAEKESEAAQAAASSANNNVLWATTTQTPVVNKAINAAKPADRLLTDDEKYHKFITTVS